MNMIKNIILSMSLVISVIIGLTGCDEETTDGFTSVTYYAALEMQGDETVYVNLGDNYEDAGCTAVMQGEDVTDQIIVESNVNTSVGGEYTINYNISNVDGFSSSASRTVYVFDTTPSVISNGFYTVQDGTNRIYTDDDGVATKTDFSGYMLLIYQVSPGVFSISDFIGGYYAQFKDYGSDYAMTGTFQLNEDNTITPLSSLVPGWGDSLDYLKDSSVDPSTGEITYDLGYASSMNFHVILKL